MKGDLSMKPNKMCLPLDTNPIYQTWQYLLFPCGIITGNNPCGNEWIISNWIDLWGSENGISIITKGESFFDKGPLIHNLSHYIRYNELVETPDKVFDMLCTLISEGYYLEGAFDESEIPASASYKKGYDGHFYNIYGYDYDNKQLHAIGYTKREKLEPFTIDYEHFCNAVRGNQSDDNYLKLIKYNDKFEFKYDFENVCLLMKDFLNSRTRKVPYDGDDSYYGLEAQAKYVAFLERTARGRAHLDMRFCRLLMEYKSVIHTNVKRHPDYEKVKELPYYAETYDAFNQQHYLGLMYVFMRDRSVITRMIESLKTAFENEEKILRMLFE